MKDLLTIMIHPRETMRRILDAGNRRFIPVVLLAAVSSMIGDFDRSELDMIGAHGAAVVAIVIGVFIVGPLVILGLFYLYAWAIYWIGRLFEGHGTPREVRQGAAWGLVPLVWMLVYRLPLAILLPAAFPNIQFGHTAVRSGEWKITTGEFGVACAAALILLVVEVAMLAWCVFVSGNTIAEAHRFETWRGFVTWLFTAISPAIITLAAVLAM